jgi:AcrR family transcriptional regulator
MDVLTRQEQQEQTREALLDTATHVFARRGYHEAKLAEIAREAGFTTGAVYSNFDGKEGLFLALADREMNRRTGLAEALVDGLRNADDPSEALTASLDQAIEQGPETVLLFFEFWSYFARRGEPAPQFESRRNEVREAFAQALELDAERRGRRLVLPASELASTLRAVINGLGFERAVEGEEFSKDAARWAITTLLEAASEPIEPGR